jgi:hypothetical protein
MFTMETNSKPWDLRPKQIGFHALTHTHHSSHIKPSLPFSWKFGNEGIYGIKIIENDETYYYLKTDFIEHMGA